MKITKSVLIMALGSACAFSVGCGGGSSSPKTNTTNTVTPTATPSGPNVAPITVNAGPDGNYANGAFASVTVCVPGTLTCQTIGGVLVDTGSVGLRVLSSALTIALPQQKAADGNPVVECLPFLASYTWGPVQTADVQIAGESAGSVPIQVLSDSDFKVPSGCTNSGMPSADTLTTLGANGILGVGLFAQDCGGACVSLGASNPGLYYECPSSGCVQTAEPVTQQVQNPVALFASDNNGVIIELPAVSGAEASVNGALIFGIGTQSNNGLGGATVFTTDPNGLFTASYNGKSYPGSFIDSGSNGYFFLETSITGVPTCKNATGFYCPTNTANFTVTNQGDPAGSGSVTFGVANAETLFANPGDSAFGDLGGPAPDYFDWGLPFFYGRSVYTAIEGKSAPGGTPPYWAY